MKTRKTASILLAALILAAALAPTAGAAYAPVSGGQVTFDQVLILPEGSTVPNLSFSYSIAPGTGIAPRIGMVAVFAGDDPAVSCSPTITPTVTFSSSSTFTDGSDTWAVVQGGKKAAVGTVTVDFTGVGFSKPGVYRWIVTEASTAASGTHYDTQTTSAGSVRRQRVLDVYVTQDDEGRLQTPEYLLHEIVDAPANYDPEDGSTPVAAGDKSYGFVAEFDGKFDLILTERVTGNQGSLDKYFQYEITITNLVANGEYRIEWVEEAEAKDPFKSDATSYPSETMKAANASDDNSDAAGQQWKASADGGLSKTVYLKHGQQLTVRGLPDGTNYTITVNREDYGVQTVKTPVGQEPIEGSDVTVEHSTGMHEDHQVDYILNKGIAIPTGVALSVLPGLALVMAAVFGLVWLRRKNREE